MKFNIPKIDLKKIDLQKIKLPKFKKRKIKKIIVIEQVLLKFELENELSWICGVKGDKRSFLISLAIDERDYCNHRVKLLVGHFFFFSFAIGLLPDKKTIAEFFVQMDNEYIERKALCCDADIKEKTIKTTTVAVETTNNSSDVLSNEVKSEAISAINDEPEFGISVSANEHKQHSSEGVLNKHNTDLKQKEVK